MSYGLLLLRVVVGATMFAHGAQKLFGWFGGHGLKATAGFFAERLGYRVPLAMAIMAGLSEAGGAFLAAGLLTPLACLGIAVVMLNAIGTVHWPKGFWATNGGYEFNLALLTVAVAIAATGPGRFSLDRALGLDDDLSGLWWGIGVLGAAAILAFLIVNLGRKRQPAQPQTEA